jgi:uncharacterized membrane protein YwaF
MLSQKDWNVSMTVFLVAALVSVAVSWTAKITWGKAYAIALAAVFFLLSFREKKSLRGKVSAASVSVLLGIFLYALAVLIQKGYP